MNAAILVRGLDARKFLQGQLTCDMNLLTEDYSLFGAHCNLKGRVEALYDVFLHGEDIHLVTSKEVIEQALAHLQYYARFSKVQLSIIESPCAPSEHVKLHPQTVGRYLPQELGLDQSDAISFTKGCYLGQEIVARLHHLGKLKKKLIITRFDYPVKPGEVVQHLQWGEVEVVDVDRNQAWVLQ